jgi:hypothetical protein
MPSLISEGCEALMTGCKLELVAFRAIFEAMMMGHWRAGEQMSYVGVRCFVLPCVTTYVYDILKLSCRAAFAGYSKEVQPCRHKISVCANAGRSASGSSPTVRSNLATSCDHERWKSSRYTDLCIRGEDSKYNIHFN